MWTVSLICLCQSRLAVNMVTLGDFEGPFRINIFVRDLFAGFSLVNRKLLVYSPAQN